ncbi:MAG: helix-turn-helix transcriptional regulator [Ruminococcaceae bacterium]|nr:helix-turn-helix transcriptional regulator [Oscillospiraceae bacterium]
MIKGLPENLKYLRMQYGYSQKQVAEKTGISPSIVSGYETGERTPSTEVLLSFYHMYLWLGTCKSTQKHVIVALAILFTVCLNSLSEKPYSISLVNFKTISSSSIL